MSQILHDWNDERVNVILGHVYEALPKGNTFKLQHLLQNILVLSQRAKQDFCEALHQIYF